MARKRRTREQKEKARHSFTYRFNEPGENETSEAPVKGQFKNAPKPASTKTKRPKSAKGTAETATLASVKRDLIKSLFLVSLILCLEVVLYLIWFKK